MAVFDPRDIATQQSRTFFNVALREFLRFAQFFQSIPNARTIGGHRYRPAFIDYFSDHVDPKLVASPNKIFHHTLLTMYASARKPSFHRMRLIRAMSTFMAVIMSTFGKRVRQLRLRKKLSQERLAELAGYHVKFLGAIGRGTRNPSPLTTVKPPKAPPTTPPHTSRRL